MKWAKTVATYMTKICKVLRNSVLGQQVLDHDEDEVWNSCFSSWEGKYIRVQKHYALIEI